MTSLSFDPADPFPLLAETAPHALAKKHAEAADAWLGLETAAVEARVRARLAGAVGREQELWVGLPVESLLTPYTELRAMLAWLAPPPGAQVVDLGAGYGRMGFVLARHHPGARFTGYELVAERVTEGRRALARFAGAGGLVCADLADPTFRPVEAEIYFIYDFGSREAVAKALADLREIAARRPIAVVGRGRLTRDRIERAEPWLSQVVPPQHCGNFTIYRSAATT